MSQPHIHPTAEVSPIATIGPGTSIWHHAQIREHATIGPRSIIGKGAYIGAHVHIGANCKIQNYACIYEGNTLQDGVFIGPAVILTNDRYPRAINPDGTLKAPTDWELTGTLVQYGAAIGARSVILPGLTIGRWALVAAGSVVTHNIPDHALVAGNPARQLGWVCTCARPLPANLTCPHCQQPYRLISHAPPILQPIPTPEAK